MLLGLVAPTAGRALVGGRRRRPGTAETNSGADTEATGFHPRPDRQDHLRVLAGGAESRQRGCRGSGHRRPHGRGRAAGARLPSACASASALPPRSWETRACTSSTRANDLDPSRDGRTARPAAGPGHRRTHDLDVQPRARRGRRRPWTAWSSFRAARSATPVRFKRLTGTQGETLEAAFLRLTSDIDTDPVAGASCTPLTTAIRAEVLKLRARRSRGQWLLLAARPGAGHRGHQRPHGLRRRPAQPGHPGKGALARVLNLMFALAFRISRSGASTGTRRSPIPT